MRVALIATLLNEGQRLDATLAAIDAQTRQPDEIVIVDGGSTDGSFERLEQWASAREDARVERREGANIPAGRNAAIDLTSSEAIAVTDGGCVLEPMWLEKLADALDGGADVAMGFYAADARTPFERMMSCLNLPDADEVDPDRFMPSSRSVAFRREVWEQAGGYPEWLPIGEDMYFDFKIVESGASRRFVPEAMVHWHLRPDIGSTFRQYFRYARGDGRSGMYPERHALRFLTYGAACAVAAAGMRRRWLLWLLPVGASARMRPAYRRALRRLPQTEAAASLVALPVLEAVLDAAKMAGYVAGRIDRRR